MLVVGHDHGNMAVGSIVLSVVPIGKLIGTRKSEFAGTPPLTWRCFSAHLKISETKFSSSKRKLYS